MIHFLVDILFLLAIALAGYATLGIVDRQDALDEPERLTLAFPAGLGAVGAVLYTLNILGILFDRPLVLGTLALFTVLGGGFLLRRPRRLFSLLKRLRNHRFRPGLAGSIALGVAFLIAAGYFTQAYFRVNYQFDTEMYHFPHAAIIFRTHHQPAYATVSAGEEFSFPPALFEVYAAQWTCLGRVDQLLPNLIPIPLFLCWSLLTALALRRVLGGSDTAIAFSLLLFTSTYEISSLLCGEGTDFLPVLLVGAAAYLVALDCRDGSARRLPVTVLMVGLNGWIKYHGVPFAICLAAALILSAWNLPGNGITLTNSLKAAVRGAIWIVVGAAVLVSPLFIRNAIDWHNPVYPAGCKWLGGFMATPWAVRIVADHWQPPYPFYQFPSVLCRTLREPAVLLGIPALVGAWRQRNAASCTLVLPGLLFLILFLALLSNRTPLPLRFAAPALGLLSWIGGTQIDRIGAGDRAAARTLAGWCILSGILIALYVLFLGPHVPPLNRGSWLDPVNKMVAFADFWWMVPFAVLVVLTVAARGRSLSPEFPALAAVMFLGVVALIHHGPFNELAHDRQLGVLQKPDWSRPPARTPLFKWMVNHMDAHSVTYTYYRRRWSIPGALLPADNPLFEWIHRPGVSLASALEALQQAGVTHVLVPNDNPELVEYEAYRTDPIIRNLGDSHSFQLLDKFMGAASYRVVYPVKEKPLTPDAAHPMPWLMEFAASGIH